jgi:hypothetical protein
VRVVSTSTRTALFLGVNIFFTIPFRSKVYFSDNVLVVLSLVAGRDGRGERYFSGVSSKAAYDQDESAQALQHTM